MTTTTSPSPPPSATTTTISQCSSTRTIDTTATSSTPTTEEHGSSVGAAIFNFTNCMIGAGAIGLGGAIAESGGLISVFSILFFGLLTKWSLDLIIELSVKEGEKQGTTQQPASPASVTYEDLGRIALGPAGLLCVLLCKFFYAFGCLVAYVIVVKNNFGPAILSLIYPNEDAAVRTPFGSFLEHDGWVTWFVSVTVLLPLCLLRDMTPLAAFSLVGVAAMISIVLIVIYLFCAGDGVGQPSNGWERDWLEIRNGFLPSLGTFVFTFCAQHTCHLTFTSLKPSLRTVENWRVISTASVGISAMVSLAIGVFVYMTYWDQTQSNIFELYPPVFMIDLAKLLLCITMMLTFPLPLFACRELLIVLFRQCCSNPRRAEELNAAANGETSLAATVTSDADDSPTRMTAGLQEPLLQPQADEHQQALALPNGDSAFPDATAQPESSLLLLPDQENQLVLPLHVLLTAGLWSFVTFLAVTAPSLGDVLDLVGCACGAMIGFILPALFCFALDGYRNFAVLILVVGGLVGVIGTYYSFQKLIADMS